MALRVRRPITPSTGPGSHPARSRARWSSLAWGGVSPMLLAPVCSCAANPDAPRRSIVAAAAYSAEPGIRFIIHLLSPWEKSVIGQRQTRNVCARSHGMREEAVTDAVAGRVPHPGAGRRGAPRPSWRRVRKAEVGAPTCSRTSPARRFRTPQPLRTARRPGLSERMTQSVTPGSSPPGPGGDGGAPDTAPKRNSSRGVSRVDLAPPRSTSWCSQRSRPGPHAPGAGSKPDTTKEKRR